MYVLYSTENAKGEWLCDVAQLSMTDTYRSMSEIEVSATFLNQGPTVDPKYRTRLKISFYIDE